MRKGRCTVVIVILGVIHVGVMPKFKYQRKTLASATDLVYLKIYERRREKRVNAGSQSHFTHRDNITNTKEIPFFLALRG